MTEESLGINKGTRCSLSGFKDIVAVNYFHTRDTLSTPYPTSDLNSSGAPSLFIVGREVNPQAHRSFIMTIAV